MRVFRRRLASSALLLTVLQLALSFAAPVSACCIGSAGGRTASVAAADDDAPDCCPPGAHPKGECPLHRNKPAHCRITCGHSSSPQFLLGAIGILPSPAVVRISFAESALPPAARVSAPARPSVPDAPPPEFF